MAQERSIEQPGQRDNSANDVNGMQPGHAVVDAEEYSNVVTEVAAGPGRRSRRGCLAFRCMAFAGGSSTMIMSDRGGGSMARAAFGQIHVDLATDYA